MVRPFGMERWDEEGPISRLNAILDAGNMKRREKFSLYAIVSKIASSHKTSVAAVTILTMHHTKFDGNTVTFSISMKP